MLPLSKQNAYRERYAALRPGWRASGAEFEALTHTYLAPQARVLSLPGGHFDAYLGEQFERAVSGETAFLVEHLNVARSQAPAAALPGASN